MMMQQRLFAVSAEEWNPHGYQRKAMKYLLEHACAALFLDPGLGKTSVTLGAIKVLKKKKVLDKVLIIAPLRVVYNVWPAEVEKWQDFSHLKVEVLHGKDKDAALKREADVYVINPEGLDWLLKTTKAKTRSGKTSVLADVKAFKKLGFDTLVIDELTKFKNQGGLRFKALAQVHHLFGRRWGLTGSPAANGLLGLFGQMYILDQGNALGKYVTHYRNKYFDQVDNVAYTYRIKPGAEAAIYERVAPMSLRMSAEDYLELPELVINRIKIDMPPKAKAQYDAMEEDLLLAIENKTVVASNAAVAAGKCRQIANGALFEDALVTESGFAIDKGPRKWHAIHDAKLDALEDLIDELQGAPLLCAYWFAHDLERLRAKFPEAEFACDYPGTKFKDLERRWNAGEIPLLFGQPASIGHGLNLQESGNHVAWFAMTFDYELWDQFIRRVLRQGNKHKKVFVHHLMMSDTVDEMMGWSLNRKAKGQNAFFTALLELAKKRKRNKL
jgi:SNF2 family DNA or RNA helicase